MNCVFAWQRSTGACASSANKERKVRKRRKSGKEDKAEGLWKFSSSRLMGKFIACDDFSGKWKIDFSRVDVCYRRFKTFLRWELKTNRNDKKFGKQNLTFSIIFWAFCLITTLKRVVWLKFSWKVSFLLFFYFFSSWHTIFKSIFWSILNLGKTPVNFGHVNINLGLFVMFIWA